MKYIVYCDESRHRTEIGYMSISGVVAKADGAAEEEIEDWRRAHGVFGEFKWNNIRDRNQGRYQLFVNKFFDMHDEGTFDFHILLAENSTRDDVRFNAGDKDLGYYKIHYQLSLHRFAKYYLTSPEDTIHLLLDRMGTAHYSLEEFRIVLNNGIRKTNGNLVRPVATVRAVESHQSNLVQVADILAGAAAYQRNGEHYRSEGRPKTGISELVRQRARINTFASSTPPSRRRLSIWNFRFD